MFRRDADLADRDYSSASRHAPNPIPATAGIGYREVHSEDFRREVRPVDWVEVHAENYTMPGGPRLSRLLALREQMGLSIHAVGLSLAGAEGIDLVHLNAVVELCRRTEPGLVSDHLAWSSFGDAYLNDLLPLPYTEEALVLVARHVDIVQETLGHPILVENPSAYLAFADSVIPETEFLTELVRRTGCGLLLDVNNVHVSSRNLGSDPLAYLDAVPAEAIGEIHLAGHCDLEIDGEVIAFDDHGSKVRERTWDLFRHLIARIGTRPTLIEWDTDLPSLAVLLAEAKRAQGELMAVAHDAP